MTMFRSNRSALAFVDSLDLAEGEFTITKLATAKYELVVQPGFAPGGAEAIVGAVEAALPAIATKVWATHPNNPANKVKVRPTRADRHYNDDGSITLYLGGRKVLRTLGDDDEDVGDEYDGEETITRYLNRHFPKRSGGWEYGRTTRGHNWHTKAAKAARLRAAAKK